MRRQGRWTGTDAIAPLRERIAALQLLLEEGKITEQQLEQVRWRQKRVNLPQHRPIVDLNFASEEDTWRALARANNLEYLDPVAMDLKRETLELVPIKFIFNYHLLPLGSEED